MISHSSKDAKQRIKNTYVKTIEVFREKTGRKREKVLRHV